MSLSVDDKTKQLLAMVGSALDQANLAFTLLADHLTVEEPEPIASDDPATCQHPTVMKLEAGARTELMCETCGENLGPAYINGG